MKQNEIVTLGLIIVVSAVIAWFGGRLILNPDKTKKTPIEVLQPISSEFTVPSNEIFNEDARNFTERIKIGENNTDKVFE
jgi:hypothetical protein